MNYNKFPHIFNKIIGYITDTKEVEEIQEMMERIRGYNYRVYVGIVREKIELHQIRKLDTKHWMLLTSQSAKHGYIELLRYLHERGCEWDSETCRCAVRKGQIECLRYLHENGCEWNQITCVWAAAEKGQIECLRYLHENGCEWDIDTCKSAAKKGHIECLRYAHEKGCEWDKETCLWATLNGEIECLKYAHEEGCEYDKEELLMICNERCREYILNNM